MIYMHVHTHMCIHTHTKSLYVADSKIPGAGKGLFTDEVIEKDSFICPYGGTLYTDEEYEALRNQQYGVELKQGLIVSAHCKRHSKFGRYANNKPGNNNAKLARDTTTQKVALMSTKRIEKGGEIYVGYGCEFSKLVNN